jgi:hypothetical protein
VTLDLLESLEYRRDRESSDKIPSRILCGNGTVASATHKALIAAMARTVLEQFRLEVVGDVVDLEAR